MGPPGPMGNPAMMNPQMISSLPPGTPPQMMGGMPSRPNPPDGTDAPDAGAEDNNAGGDGDNTNSDNANTENDAPDDGTEEAAPV